LLELLAALVLVSMVAAMVFSGFSTAGRLWGTADENSARRDELRLAHQLLRRQLSEALNYGRASDDGWVVAFAGDAKRLEFVRESSAPFIAPGLRRVLVAYDPTSGSLEFRSGGLQRDSQRARAKTDVVDAIIVESPRHIEFSYFGDRPDADPGWQHNWANRDSLPALVRLSVTSKDGTEWPPLIVELNATAKRAELVATLDEGLP